MLINPTVNCIGVGGAGGGVTLTETLISLARAKEGSSKNGIISSNFFIILFSPFAYFKICKTKKKEKKLTKFLLLNEIIEFKQGLPLLRK
jgi:hypothetical protein